MKLAIVVIAIAALGSGEVRGANAKIGELVGTQQVTSNRPLLRIENDREMCSPAVLVGPRVFLTAAHCTVLLQKTARVLGPETDIVAGVTVLSMPVVTDDEFFEGRKCRELITRTPDQAVLTTKELSVCWFREGSADLALVVVDRDVPGAMLNLDFTPPRPKEMLFRLGENAKCGGDEGLFHRVRLTITGFSGSQALFENRDESQSELATCGGGDSGGIYYRKTGSVAGVHSASVQKPGPYQVYGKSIYLPVEIYGGTVLAAARPRRWLKQMARDHGLKICGLNIRCDGGHAFAQE